MGIEGTHNHLDAWREAVNLVEAVYRDTECLPAKEVFGLTAQIRRARNSRKEFVHFLGIRCGSLAELETQLQLAVRLQYLAPTAPCISQAARVGQLLGGFRRYLKRVA